jgi:hypothetical protein
MLKEKVYRLYSPQNDRGELNVIHFMLMSDNLGEQSGAYPFLIFHHLEWKSKDEYNLKFIVKKVFQATKAL